MIYKEWRQRENEVDRERERESVREREKRSHIERAEKKGMRERNRAMWGKGGIRM